MLPLPIIMVVRVAVAAVSAAFGLEAGVHSYQIGSEAMQHILDYVVRSDTKKLVSNIRRQMAISEVPSKAHKLIGIFMRDFDTRLRSCLNL
jgi:hypothetical protein